MRNNNLLSDTNTEYVDAQSSSAAAHLPSVLTLEEDRLTRELCFATECLHVLIILLISFVCRFSFLFFEGQSGAEADQNFKFEQIPQRRNVQSVLFWIIM